jgi:hypothetical protein
LHSTAAHVPKRSRLPAKPRPGERSRFLTQPNCMSECGKCQTRSLVLCAAAHPSSTISVSQTYHSRSRARSRRTVIVQARDLSIIEKDRCASGPFLRFREYQSTTFVVDWFSGWLSTQRVSDATTWQNTSPRPAQTPDPIASLFAYFGHRDCHKNLQHDDEEHVGEARWMFEKAAHVGQAPRHEWQPGKDGDPPEYKLRLCGLFRFCGTTTRPQNEQLSIGDRELDGEPILRHRAYSYLDSHASTSPPLLSRQDNMLSTHRQRQNVE